MGWRLGVIAVLPTLLPAGAAAYDLRPVTEQGSVTTGVGLLISAGGTTAGMVAKTTLQEDKLPAGPTEREAERTRELLAQAAADWLRQNAAEVRLGLSSGRGPVIDDLAASVEVPVSHRRLFGKKLRSNRKELLELSSPSSLTPERAIRFLGRIGEIMEGDPELRADLQAWETRTTRLTSRWKT